MSPTIHAQFGTWPATLLTPVAGAQQYSPLVLGSSSFTQTPATSLAGLQMLAPPGTIERRYTLARALVALAPNAPLTVFAPKDKGGNRIAADMEELGCTVEESARQHYRFVTAQRPPVLDTDAISHAIDAGAARIVPEMRLWSQPGVFSWNRVDTGSALLLLHLPQLGGDGADLGCGIGILSRAALASSAVHSLTLIDIDRRAVDAARRNITDSRAHFLWADACNASTAIGPCDFVVMNPPFHDAGTEDKSLGQAFVTRAASLLKPGGQCWLVANRHLPYEVHLREHFSRVMLVDEADGFKVYASTK